jgi:hypothetical protein
MNNSNIRLGRLKAIGEEVLAEARRERTDAQCLIALNRPEPQLLLFQFGTINNKFGSICQRMESYAIAGDSLNAAIFWAERYYQKLPIERLIPLSAHLVFIAHRFNSATISGLEIVACKPDGIHRLSPQSLADLECQAEVRDSNLGEDLLSGTQQFSYAPDLAG